MVKKMYKAVIFDLDGTLTDTLDDLADAVNHVLTQHGFATRSREEVRSFVGNGLCRLMRRSLPAEVSDEDAQVYTQQLTAYYKAHALDKTKPYEGIVPLLKKLNARGVVCAVATNKRETAAVDICRHFFGDLVVLVKGDNGTRPLKPDKACIDEILQELHLAKEDVLYVGDSEPDAYTARNAGLQGVGVLWGFRSAEQLREAGFDKLAGNCEELFNVVENFS